MSTVQTRSTAFRAGDASSYGARPQPALRSGRTSAAPARRAPTPVPAPAVGARSRAETQRLGLMVLMACLLVAVGLAYLAFCAQVTREGYRRVQLKAALQREHDLANRWTQQKALLNAPAVIEQQIKRLGMVPADDKNTVTVQ